MTPGRHSAWLTGPGWKPAAACRSIARHSWRGAADRLAVFRALQAAFYVDGLDTTDGRILATVAAAALRAQGRDVGTDAVHAAWLAPETVAGTQADFHRARALGVRSFPALLLETPDGIQEIAPGYAHTAALDLHLGTLLDRYAVSH